MIQIVEQTREEKIEMYMELDKRKLAEMLAACNSHNESVKPKLDYYIDFYNDENGNLRYKKIPNNTKK